MPDMKEMMKSAHPRLQAVASAMAMKRKSKQMAMAKGGMILPSEERDKGEQEIPDFMSPPGGKEASMAKMDEQPHDSYQRDLVSMQKQGNQQIAEAENPNEQMEDARFAAAVRKMSMSRPPEGMMGYEGYSMGGLVSPMHTPEMGDKPSENMMDGDEDMSRMPMKPSDHQEGQAVMPSGPGLSEEARKALAKKKQMRMYR